MSNALGKRKRFDKSTRKRGNKKHRTETESEEAQAPQTESWFSDPGPSWISTTKAQQEPEYPFGEVDQDLKVYLRSVNVRLEEWNSTTQDADLLLTEDEIADRKLFLASTAEEIKGHEAPLATDPECSRILERILSWMDNDARRVVFNSLLKHFAVLAQHRFGSHVCETLIQMTPQGIQAEASAESKAPETAEPTMIELVTAASTELLPLASSLLRHPFGAHVLRRLMQLLAARTWDEMDSDSPRAQKGAFSKKRHGPLLHPKGGQTQTSKHADVPKEFFPMAVKFMSAVSKDLGAEDVRTLAMDEVAGPSLHAFVKVEIRHGTADKPKSLVNVILSGDISELAKHKVASILLESIISLSPDSSFHQIWEKHLSLNAAAFINHPVANFVMSTAFSRVNEDELSELLYLPAAVWTECIAGGRHQVLLAIVDRAATIQAHEDGIVQLIETAFGFVSKSAADGFLRHILVFKPKDAMETASDDRLTVSLQGSLLAQSLLHLSEPHNGVVKDPILSLSVEQKIQLGKSAEGSRVYDAFLESRTIPHISKQQLITSVIGSYHVLDDDKFGSRVAENMWKWADPFVRERIARSLFNYESVLRESRYGKYWLQALRLQQLKAAPEAWKKSQLEAYREAHSPPRPQDEGWTKKPKQQ